MCNPNPELNIKNAFIIVVLIIITHAIFNAAAYGILFIIGELSGKSNSSDFPFELYHALNLLFVAISNCLVIIILFKRYKLDLSNEFTKVRVSPLLLLLALAFFIFAMILPMAHPRNFFIKLIEGTLIVHELDFQVSSFGFSRIVYLILMVFAFPVLEEIIFRGFVFRLLLKRYSLIASMLLSSFLFAFMHLRFMGFAYLFVYGLLFAYAYYRSGSLLTPVLLHAFINLMANLTKNQYIELNSGNLVKHLLFYLVGTACVVFFFSLINRGEKALKIETENLKVGLRSILRKRN